jgi:hypothetical protein
MSKIVDDREYIQPEQDTIDFLVYAEYINWQLRQIGKDVRDAISRQDGQSG